VYLRINIAISALHNRTVESATDQSRCNCQRSLYAIAIELYEIALALALASYSVVDVVKHRALLRLLLLQMVVTR